MKGKGDDEPGAKTHIRPPRTVRNKCRAAGAGAAAGRVRVRTAPPEILTRKRSKPRGGSFAFHRHTKEGRNEGRRRGARRRGGGTSPGRHAKARGDTPPLTSEEDRFAEPATSTSRPRRLLSCAAPASEAAGSAAAAGAPPVEESEAEDSPPPARTCIQLSRMEIWLLLGVFSRSELRARQAAWRSVIGDRESSSRMRAARGSWVLAMATPGRARFAEATSVQARVRENRVVVAERATPPCLLARRCPATLNRVETWKLILERESPRGAHSPPAGRRRRYPCLQ